MPLGQFNALSGRNLLGTIISAAVLQVDPNIILSRVSQQPCIADIGSFVGMQYKGSLE